MNSTDRRLFEASASYEEICEATGDSQDTDAIKADVAEAYKNLLIAMRIDPTGVDVADTPDRVSRMFIEEVYKGRYAPLPKPKLFDREMDVLDHTVENSIITVGPIKTRSACSHHFVPTIGECVVSYIPGITTREEGSSEDVGMYTLHSPGLSKLERIVDHVVSKPYMQEKALTDVAETLMRELKLGAVLVDISAEHLCTTWRGVKTEGSRMQQRHFISDRKLLPVMASYATLEFAMDTYLQRAGKL